MILTLKIIYSEVGNCCTLSTGMNLLSNLVEEILENQQVGAAPCWAMLLLGLGSILEGVLD